ncbi:MAG TPA: hypothetical protein VM260_25085 [Pirellula sp.]|nr:hypothetical protein [Pirellula sp.]
MNLFDALIEDSIIAPLPLKNGEQRREIWICIRTDGAIGEGSRVNPYNGATQPLFDALMRFVNETSKVQANMTVRLGPGVFQTRGGDGGGFVGAWRPQSGQRIIGSGMHATILQLVDAGAIFQDVGQNVIGSNSNVNNFEISDLTLDCNFARQLNPDGDPDNYNNVMLAGELETENLLML